MSFFFSGKNHFIPTYVKFTFEFQKSRLEKDFTTTPTYFLSKNYACNTELLKVYWKIKLGNFKRTWCIARKLPTYNLSKRKCCMCLNKKLEKNSCNGKNSTKQKIRTNQEVQTRKSTYLVTT